MLKKKAIASIQRVLGTGAFSRVEITRYRRTGFYYSLKTMNIHSVVSKKQMQHVHNEKRILETLNHPFIVKMWAITYLYDLIYTC